MRLLNKYNLLIFTFLFIFLYSSSLFALELVVNNQAPEFEAFGNTKDVLVMDFSINLSNNVSDKLNAITIQNIGDTNISDIEKVKIWADKGGPGFDGFAIDELLGVASYNGITNSWMLYDLSYVISGTSRIFVTIDTKRNVTTDSFMQFRVPAYFDKNSNLQYDIDDLGIFSEKGILQLKDSIVNENKITLNNLNGDLLAPIFAIKNLYNNQTLFNYENILLQGYVRDQQSNLVKDAFISITQSLEERDWKSLDLKLNNDYIYSWEYNWQGLDDGTYYIALKASDQSYNVTEESPIKINVKKESIIIEVPEIENNISIENSSVFVNRGLAIRAPFEDNDIYIQVDLKDINNKPVSDKMVNIYVERPGKKVSSTLKTGVDGDVIWIITSAVNAVFTISVEVDGNLLLQNPTIKFIDARLDGELIKGENSKAVYLLKGDKRYVFPTESVYKSYYQNFNNVRQVPDDELASYQLGGNITYRPGSLIKIPSLSKVYRVNENSILNWIENEEKARRMYGPTWASLVHDVSDSSFIDYQIGDKI